MDNLTKNNTVKDLQIIINLLEQRHPNPFINISKQELNNLIFNFKENGKDNSCSCLYFLNYILKNINDPHTTIDNPINF